VRRQETRRGRADRGRRWPPSQWQGRLYNASVVAWLQNDWKSGIIRVAMGVEHKGGYPEQPEAEKAKVSALVDAAIANDIYVIIDWHDHNAHYHTVQAAAFFGEVARKYGSHPYFMNEIWNEPTEVSHLER
jgi:endoglucanase